MTNTQIKLVKESWTYVLGNSKQAGELFYTKLFEIAPELRVMFPNDIKEQAGKLLSMVTLIVTKLDKLEDVINEIIFLSKRHKGYGAKSEHFKKVGSALIWTLQQGLGDKWNTDLEQAWEKVYEILSKAMIENMTK